jgi:hypothetical protein
LSQGKWVDYGASIEDGWSAAGILQGPDLAHVNIKDLCIGQVSNTAVYSPNSGRSSKHEEHGNVL